MATNKVIYGDRTLIDTSGDTASPSDVRSGSTFHSASGEQLTGTATVSEVIGVKGNSESSYRTGNVNLTSANIGSVNLTDKYTRSNAGGLDWVDTSEGDSKVISKSALAFWNGTYNGSASNLSKCSTGNIIGSNGGTMTGQLKTSFKTSVAMGSYGSAQSTVEGLVGEVRFSSGCAGSVNFTSNYTANNVTIAGGWYNFMYMPHRSGGNSGAADGDNVSYGNLFLFGMNNTNGRFIVRVSSGSIADVCRIWTSLETAWAYMYISSKQLNNTETKITGLSLRGGGNYTDYFDINTANQIKIKKAGVYHVEIYMRFTSVTNAANVKRISVFKNGASNVACLGRPNSYEDVTFWDLQTYAANDVLTMYGRSEDGNATVSFPRVFIKPLF